MTEGTAGRQIKSVARAIQVIEYLQDNGESRLSDVAEAIDLTPGTVHTYLATLENHKYVERTGHAYKLGQKLVPLGESTRTQSALYAAGKDEVDSLAFEYDAVAHLITEFDDKLLVLYESYGKHSIGKKFHMRKLDQPQVHMHCTAAGKTLLAFSPSSQLQRIIDRYGLPKYTTNTITDEGTLLDELETIRERGYALNDQEMMNGNRGVGAPIHRDDGALEGAISISGPANAWKSDFFREQLPTVVMRSANNTEINLQLDAD